MEAFSLLKYWRSGPIGGGDVILTSTTANDSASAAASTTTIVAALSHRSSQSEEEDDNHDDGPFFDLEFTTPDAHHQGERRAKIEENEEVICVKEDIDKAAKDDESTEDDSDYADDDENEEDLKFTLSSPYDSDAIDRNVSLSPADDLFFKGRLVPISETNTKSASLLSSATKLGVLMFKLKKKSSKSNAPEKTKSEKNESQSLGKFTRDYSTKGAINKPDKNITDKSSEDDRGFSKDVMQRYFNKVKPLYVRVSKLGFSEHLNLSGAIKAGLASPPPSTAITKSPEAPAERSVTIQQKEREDDLRRGDAKCERRMSLPGTLRVASKQLGKGRSSAVAASPPGAVASRRRDDSLLQQQDGIQSAIMHCKRSFIATRDSEASGVLSEKSIMNQSTDDSSLKVDRS